MNELAYQGPILTPKAKAAVAVGHWQQVAGHRLAAETNTTDKTNVGCQWGRFYDVISNRNFGGKELKRKLQST
jgi:hypothetical protein